jgi:hypothetical protein
MALNANGIGDKPRIVSLFFGDFLVFLCQNFFPSNTSTARELAKIEVFVRKPKVEAEDSTPIDILHGDGD